MKTSEGIIIFFVITCLSTLILYNAMVQYKTNTYYEKHNKLCGEMTTELNARMNASSNCVDYYCYYIPTSAPAGLENTTTPICICDCKLVNGTVMSFQILAPNSSVSYNINT